MSRYEPEKFPHQWLPEPIELKSWDQIEPWYHKLLAQPVHSAAELEQWLAAAGELNAAVGEEGARRYIAMTCQTDDPVREAAYLAFVRDIEPKLKPLQNQIRNRYLDAPERSHLSQARYAVFDRALENRRALFREANIPRETQLAELEQQYQKIDRRHDRELPRPGAHLAPDGSAPRRNRPVPAQGSLGAFRRAPPAGSRNA